MDQSLVVATVKAMSISGIVKQLSIVSKVFLYLFFLRKGIDNQLNCLFGVHTHLVCNVPPCKWTLELSVGIIFCSITKVFIFYQPHGYVIEFDGTHRLDIFIPLLLLLPAQIKSNINSNPTSVPLWSLSCTEWGLSLVRASFELLNLSLVKMRCLFLGRNGVYLKINLKKKKSYHMCCLL